MRVLSATEAVAPAFKRTMEIFFKPFRFGRSWKWGASAYVGQMGFCFAPLFLILPFVQNVLHDLPKGAIIAIWIGTVVMSAINFIFYYLGARMQFVLFEAIATRASHVAPLWRKYGSRTWKWIGITIAPLTVLITAAGVPMSLAYIGLFKNMPKPGVVPQDPFAGFHQMMTFELIMFLCMGVVIVLATLLGDFVLPSIALEDVSAGAALKRLRDLVATEPGQVAALVLLKLVLFMVGFMAWYAALIILMLLSLIPIGIIGVISWLIFHGMGTAGHIILIVEAVIGYIVVFAWLFYIEIGSIGILPMFMQAYGMYFLGGRYPLLGNLLEPPAPPVALQTDLPPTFEPPSPQPAV